MKKTLKLLGIVAIAAIIGFSFTSCGDSGPSPAPAAPANPTSKIFESKDTAGNIYILEVTSKSAVNASISRAAAVPAYTPKDGDTFTLTIITSSGDTWTDSGTVAISGTTLTLSGTKASTLSITVSGNDMTKIEVPEGTTITVEGTTITTVTLTSTGIEGAPKTWGLHPSWGGDSWDGNIELKKITGAKPKKDETFRFKISGTPDKTLEKFGIGLIAYPDGWGDSQWLGSSRQVNVSGPFEEIFEITVLDDPTNGWNIDISVANNVPFPSNVSAGGGQILATISNFELRFIGVK